MAAGSLDLTTTILVADTSSCDAISVHGLTVEGIVVLVGNKEKTSTPPSEATTKRVAVNISGVALLSGGIILSRLPPSGAAADWSSATEQARPGPVPSDALRTTAPTVAFSVAHCRYEAPRHCPGVTLDRVVLGPGSTVNVTDGNGLCFVAASHVHTAPAEVDGALPRQEADSSSASALAEAAAHAAASGGWSLEVARVNFVNGELGFAVSVANCTIRSLRMSNVNYASDDAVGALGSVRIHGTTVVGESIDIRGFEPRRARAEQQSPAVTIGSAVTLAAGAAVAIAEITGRSSALLSIDAATLLGNNTMTVDLTTAPELFSSHVAGLTVFIELRVVGAGCKLAFERSGFPAHNRRFGGLHMALHGSSTHSLEALRWNASFRSYNTAVESVAVVGMRTVKAVLFTDLLVRADVHIDGGGGRSCPQQIALTSSEVRGAVRVSNCTWASVGTTTGTVAPATNTDRIWRGFNASDVTAVRFVVDACALSGAATGVNLRRVTTNGHLPQLRAHVVVFTRLRVAQDAAIVVADAHVPRSQKAEGSVPILLEDIVFDGGVAQFGRLSTNSLRAGAGSWFHIDRSVLFSHGAVLEIADLDLPASSLSYQQHDLAIYANFSSGSTLRLHAVDSYSIGTSISSLQVRPVTFAAGCTASIALRDLELQIADIVLTSPGAGACLGLHLDSVRARAHGTVRIHVDANGGNAHTFVLRNMSHPNTVVTLRQVTLGGTTSPMTPPGAAWHAVEGGRIGALELANVSVGASATFLVSGVQLRPRGLYSPRMLIRNVSIGARASLVVRDCSIHGPDRAVSGHSGAAIDAADLALKGPNSTLAMLNVDTVAGISASALREIVRTFQFARVQVAGAGSSMLMLNNLAAGSKAGSHSFGSVSLGCGSRFGSWDAAGSRQFRATITDACEHPAAPGHEGQNHLTQPGVAVRVPPAGLGYIRGIQITLRRATPRSLAEAVGRAAAAEMKEEGEPLDRGGSTPVASVVVVDAGSLPYASASVVLDLGNWTLHRVAFVRALVVSPVWVGNAHIRPLEIEGGGAQQPSGIFVHEVQFEGDRVSFALERSALDGAPFVMADQVWDSKRIDVAVVTVRHVTFSTRPSGVNATLVTGGGGAVISNVTGYFARPWSRWSSETVLFENVTATVADPTTATTTGSESNRTTEALPICMQDVSLQFRRTRNEDRCADALHFVDCDLGGAALLLRRNVFNSTDPSGNTNSRNLRRYRPHQVLRPRGGPMHLLVLEANVYVEGKTPSLPLAQRVAASRNWAFNESAMTSIGIAGTAAAFAALNGSTAAGQRWEACSTTGGFPPPHPEALPRAGGLIARTASGTAAGVQLTEPCEIDAADARVAQEVARSIDAASPCVSSDTRSRILQHAASPPVWLTATVAAVDAATASMTAIPSSAFAAKRSSRCGTGAPTATESSTASVSVPVARQPSRTATPPVLHRTHTASSTVAREGPPPMPPPPFHLTGTFSLQKVRVTDELSSRPSALTRSLAAGSLSQTPLAAAAASADSILRDDDDGAVAVSPAVLSAATAVTAVPVVGVVVAASPVGTVARAPRIASTARMASCASVAVGGDGTTVEVSLFEYPFQFPLDLGGSSNTDDASAEPGVMVVPPELHGGSLANTLIVVGSFAAAEVAFDRLQAPRHHRKMGAVSRWAALAAAVFVALLGPPVFYAAAATFTITGASTNASTMFFYLALVAANAVALLRFVHRALRLRAQPGDSWALSALLSLIPEPEPDQHAAEHVTFDPWISGAREPTKRFSRLHVCVDIVVSCALGLCAGAQASVAACLVSGVLGLIIALAYLGYVGLLRPLHTRLDTAFAVAIALLQLLPVVVGVMAAARPDMVSGALFTAVDWAVVAQIVLLLAQCVLVLALGLKRRFCPSTPPDTAEGNANGGTPLNTDHQALLLVPTQQRQEQGTTPPMAAAAPRMRTGSSSGDDGRGRGTTPVVVNPLVASPTPPDSHHPAATALQ